MNSVDFLVPAGGPPFWVMLLSTVPVAVIGAVWLVLGTTVALKGDEVERPNRVAQLYGYTVCLVALVVTIVSVASLLNALIDRANPLQSEWGFGTTLTSFEAYKATSQRERGVYGRDSQMPADTASEGTLRQRYDALVADRLAATRYRTSKALITSGVLLIFAAALFVSHWRWLKRVGNAAVG